MRPAGRRGRRVARRGRPSRRTLAWAGSLLGGLGVGAVVTALVLAQAPPPPPTLPPPPATSAPGTPSPAPTRGEPETGGVLRVYSNNIENLVRNEAEGACSRVTELEHISSMLVDDAGRAGTGDVAAPDLLLLQQVGGGAQARAYADRLSARFGFPAGTYRVMVAWEDPKGWGVTHDCRVRALGNEKRKQTNGIIYNSRTLTLTDQAVFAAGWLRPGTAFANGRGCTAYGPESRDVKPSRTHKWQRTTAVAARFTINGSGTTVFAATMHLPHQNLVHGCAGYRDTGVRGSGIRLDEAATRLLRHSKLRVIGIDANRTRLDPSVLDDYGLTGYGSTDTIGHIKIDYLFVRGAVQPSAIDHTVPGTDSDHLALYGFIDYGHGTGKA